MAAGELKHFTGVDDPYEAPLNPELAIKNQEMTVQEAVDGDQKSPREEWGANRRVRPG